MHSTDSISSSMYYSSIGPENPLFVGMSVLCASFSPEILQAGAVKGLTVIITISNSPTDP